MSPPTRTLSTLMISMRLPTLPMSGGAIRTYQIARALGGLGTVTIAGFLREDEDLPALEFPLRAVGVRWRRPRVWEQMHSENQATASRAYRHLSEEVREPWIVSCFDSPQLKREIRRERAGVGLVVIEHSLMGAYAAEVPRDVPLVLDLHNVHALQAQRGVMRGMQDPLEAQRVAEYERSLIGQAALTITVSEPEAAAALELVPGAPVEVVPNGVDVGHFTPGPEPRVGGCMLFTGLMSYRPNVRAVHWFAKQVLPRIERGVLHVVGSSPTPMVRELASERLIVYGEVPDTLPYQRQANVVVVPLLSGGGTRLKILEAAACGNAIVSTSIGAEGLQFVPGRDLLIADSPAEFAQAVEMVLADEELRARLGRAARQAAERYRWETIGERLLGLVRPLVAAGAGARRTTDATLSTLP